MLLHTSVLYESLPGSKLSKASWLHACSCSIVLEFEARKEPFVDEGQIRRVRFEQRDLMSAYMVTKYPTETDVYRCEGPEK